MANPKRESRSPNERPVTERDQGIEVVLLTKVQMAAALQVSLRTVTDMMRRGEISYFKIGPQVVRFHVDEALKRMRETVLVVADGEER